MIPVKLQASIFQPGITTKAAGQGMGLFIVGARFRNGAEISV